MSIANRVHITKRTGASGGAQLASRLVAIVVALAASGLVMLFMGYHPLEIFGKIITSSLSTYSRFGETMNKTILLTMLSLGISVAFRMKFWNSARKVSSTWELSARRSSRSDSPTCRHGCCFR